MMMVVMLVMMMMLLLVPPPVIVIVVVMMVVIVNELHIRIFGIALSTGSNCGRVCDPQQRGGIWNRIK